MCDMKGLVARVVRVLMRARWMVWKVVMAGLNEIFVELKEVPVGARVASLVDIVSFKGWLDDDGLSGLNAFLVVESSDLRFLKNRGITENEKV